METKNIIIGKLEKRISKEKGSTYYCINVYAKHLKSGEVRCLNKGKPIYVDSERLETLLDSYGLEITDVSN